MLDRSNAFIDFLIAAIANPYRSRQRIPGHRCDIAVSSPVVLPLAIITVDLPYIKLDKGQRIPRTLLGTFSQPSAPYPNRSKDASFIATNCRKSLRLYPSSHHYKMEDMVEQQELGASAVRGLKMLADHVALVLVELRITALTLELAVQQIAEEMLKLVDCSVAERSCRFPRCCLV